MSATSLELVELIVEEPALGCDAKDCSAPAAFAVQTPCCLRLYCGGCVGRLMIYVEEHIPCPLRCAWHLNAWKSCTKVSDFIESVQPL